MEGQALMRFWRLSPVFFSLPEGEKICILSDDFVCLQNNNG
jgi:hypothetical protein